MTDQLSEGDRQTIRIDRDGELYPLSLTLHGRHHEPNPFRFEVIVSLINIVDVEANGAGTRNF